MKIYKSDTIQSICVITKKGNSKHVSFDPMSDGTSIYFCDNKDIEFGIEHHPDFGKSISIFQDEEDINNNAENTKEAEKEDPANTITDKIFATIDDAKDFLAEEFGISRTKMRGEKAVLDAGKGVGINIVIE